VTSVLHLAAGAAGTDTARDPAPLAFGMLALAALACTATTLARPREEPSDGHRPREASAAHVVSIQPGTQPRRSRIRPGRIARYSGAHRRRSGRRRSVSLLGAQVLLSLLRDRFAAVFFVFFGLSQTCTAPWCNVSRRRRVKGHGEGNCAATLAPALLTQIAAAAETRSRER
jgi:hypothetical protein